MEVMVFYMGTLKFELDFTVDFLEEISLFLAAGSYGLIFL